MEGATFQEEETGDAASREPGTWWVVRRTIREFSADGLTDWAAALTYYGLLALFPALIVLVSLVGLVADPQPLAHKLTEIVTAIGPSSAASTFAGPIRSLAANQSAAGALFVAGTLVALWSASGYVGAFIRASNAIYESPEGRPVWKLRPLQLLLTLACVMLVALLLVGITLTGPVVDAVAGSLGVGSTLTAIWGVAKWPVMLALVQTIVALLYYASPNARLGGFRWITPGCIVAVGGWLVASALFAIYVGNFGSYDKTYGSLGAVVVLLVWLWISNLALLFGHELNAQLERRRQIAEGLPEAEQRLQLAPRAGPSSEQRVA